MLARFAMAIGILVAALMPQHASAERRVALVIGNADYEHATGLRNPGNDATDVAETLKKLDFEVLLGRDLDQQEFAKTIEQFARALDDADIGLFFYAGHGLQMNDKNYLVSINARLENEFLLSSETIELDAIVRLMESKASTNLVFLDACRNNPLTENLRRSLAALKRSAQLGRGLARMESSGRDTLFAFAAAPGQEAADGSERNSPFTAALLRHIPRQGVEVSVMLKEVAADVRRDTRNAQRPQQLSDMSRLFYFANAPAAAAPAQVVEKSTPAPDRTLDVAYWNSAQVSNDCDSVRAYIQRFPDGAFIDLARLAERRLCTMARRVTAPPEPAAPGAADASAPPLTPAPPPAASDQAPRPEPAVQPNIAALPEIAALPPEPPAAAVAQDGILARNIQLELIRLGCAKGDPEDDWNPAARDALRKFNRHAKARLNLNAPSERTMAALRGYDRRICALECGPGTRARGDTCVAIERAEPPRRHKAEPRDRTRRVSEPPPLKRRVSEPPRAQASRAASAPKSGFHSPLCESRIQVGGKWCCTYDPPRGPSVISCP